MTLTLNQRPSANELLQHRFIRNARKTSYLTELIERYQDYRARSPQKNQVNHASVRSNGTWDINDTMKSDWNFDTVKSVAALGTFRGTVSDLSLPPGMIAEDDESFDVDEEDSMDTGAATRGSEPTQINGLGMSIEAAHSTMVIKSPVSDINDTEEGPTGE